MKLLIITPFKNEEGSIAQTIESICKQTVRPNAWILVDDNSDDFSPEIVKGYSNEFRYIHYYVKGNDGARSTGKNVIDVFNYGLQKAKELGINWDVVLKLDADLVIEQDNYLEFILHKFSSYPSLGIASGATYIFKEGKKIVESKHKWHTQGPNKFYRKVCLETMGGLKPYKGWDGIDDILARHHGFVTEKFFEQPICHLYPTQTRSAEGGPRNGAIREAISYQNRDYPVYMFLLKACKLANKKKFYEAFVFLSYGLKLKRSTRPLVTEEEGRIIRAFLKQRFFNQIKYTS
ncbi:glycosyltransferase family 2 protein [Pontibacter silvestris]|uniref:Glycosyltransferase family 2 protein n=1 Tax=Pontibacter silvestris TaxID=2305183 RepID=A0ABW4WX95_9BACT|nr:glycosyltransferase family A protein [Pontibacter silvestris]MCC9138542.1 glycosyltransferase family 2 protein [Pontibacter silvestris]